MTETKEIIIRLKEVRAEKRLSYTQILAMMEENGDYVSRATLSRLFGEGSETLTFDYENTIRPIANALLDIDTDEETDNMDVQAMKSLLRYKSRLIESLEDQIKELKEKHETEIANLKVKHHEQLDSEREQSRRSIEFLKEQVSLKDKRLDYLFDSVSELDRRYYEMLKKVMPFDEEQTDISWFHSGKH